MFTTKKYKLLQMETVEASDGQTYEVHRIQALIDIPLHDVKAGDLGGYVSHKKLLSQKGSCWVGGDAVVANYKWETIIHDDALVSEQAFVSGTLRDNVKISGNAQVRALVYGNVEVSGNAFVGKGCLDGNIVVKDNARIIVADINTRYKGIMAAGSKAVVISGDAVINCPSERTEYIGVYNKFIDLDTGENIEISGKVQLNHVFIRGNCQLDGDFTLDNASLKGDNTIVGSHKIKPEVKFTGTNVITGNSVIPPGTHVHDVVMDGGVLNYSDADFSGNNVSALSPIKVADGNSASNEYITLIEQIESEYEAYTTDIVKLIKYPAMVDASVPEVVDFMSKLRSAKRALDSGNEDRLKDLAESLDLAFIRAENKVQTLVASHLDEGKKKSLRTAEKMFLLACDEASPEPEKRLGYKAGMRSLEGVLVVSDVARDNMKTRIGLLELEA